MTTRQQSALVRAIEKGDVNFVRKMLKKGTDPNHFLSCDLLQLQKPLDKNHSKIMKLLLQHKMKIKLDFITEMIKPRHSKYAEDLMTFVFNYDKSYLQKIFEELLIGPVRKRSTWTLNYEECIKILELLLDHGMPINDFVYYDVFDDNDDPQDRVKLTPMQLCIYLKRTFYVRKFFISFLNLI